MCRILMQKLLQFILIRKRLSQQSNFYAMNISLFFVVFRTQRARHENDHVPDERRETEETLARACTALIY